IDEIAAGLRLPRFAHVLLVHQPAQRPLARLRTSTPPRLQSTTMPSWLAGLIPMQVDVLLSPPFLSTIPGVSAASTSQASPCALCGPMLTAGACAKRMASRSGGAADPSPMLASRKTARSRTELYICPVPGHS